MKIYEWVATKPGPNSKGLDPALQFPEIVQGSEPTLTALRRVIGDLLGDGHTSITITTANIDGQTYAARFGTNPPRK